MYTLYALIAALLGLAIGWYLAKIRYATSQEKVEWQLQNIQQQFTEAQGSLEKKQAESVLLHEKAARLETTNSSLSQQLAEQQQNLQKMEDTLSIQFKNLANDLLEEKSKKFTDQNRVHLEALLKPLGERIQHFEKQVEQTNKEGIERNATLRTEIHKLYSFTMQITKEAENLTRAIKGDNKMQGNWGEWILETILEQSGLVKGREYEVQPSLLSAEGKRYQPDIIIQLPTAKKIIIDAKASLINYEKFFNAGQQEERTIQLKKHLFSVRKHIDNLSEKNYQSLPKAQGLDFVILFIPIEPAFSLILEHDSRLLSEAYEKNIILASPSTLIAIIRTIANIWKQEHQNQNALEIARQSGSLYDKFVDFVQDLEKVGNQLRTTQAKYDAAMNKLCEGNGSLIRKAEQIKYLGANTSKNLDPKLLERAGAIPGRHLHSATEETTPVPGPSLSTPTKQSI